LPSVMCCNGETAVKQSAWAEQQLGVREPGMSRPAVHTFPPPKEDVLCSFNLHNTLNLHKCWNSWQATVKTN
jgi:hypothetical protein